MAGQVYEQTATTRGVVVVGRGDYGLVDLQIAMESIQDRVRGGTWNFDIVSYTRFADVFVAVMDVSYRARKANRDDIRRRLEDYFGADDISVPHRSTEITDKVEYVPSR